ncbi:MAG TPA: hypothetical protein VJ483_06725 [Holophagaceae bacterium]|nr:hypothetical protein [Holophagaceae bacterium]
MTAPLGLVASLRLIRDCPALPDLALAELLGVDAEVLRAAVAAHGTRFSEDLVFRLSAEERQALPGAPVLAFTESAIALLIDLLPGAETKVTEALQGFVQARHLLSSQAALAQRVEALEQQFKAFVAALQGEGAEAKDDHIVGFVRDEPGPGLKAKQRSGGTA